MDLKYIYIWSLSCIYYIGITWAVKLVKPLEIQLCIQQPAHDKQYIKIKALRHNIWVVVCRSILLVPNVDNLPVGYVFPSQGQWYSHIGEKYVQCFNYITSSWACRQTLEPTRVVQYIPRNMHTVFALLCFVVVIHWLIFPYPSGLLHWHCGNLTIAPVPAKQPWWIWINTSCEFIMNDWITTTKQSTTKPCACFLGYTVNRTTLVGDWICLSCNINILRVRQ